MKKLEKHVKQGSRGNSIGAFLLEVILLDIEMNRAIFISQFGDARILEVLRMRHGENNAMKFWRRNLSKKEKCIDSMVLNNP